MYLDEKTMLEKKMRKQDSAVKTNKYSLLSQQHGRNYVELSMINNDMFTIIKTKSAWCTCDMHRETNFMCITHG